MARKTFEENILEAANVFGEEVAGIYSANVKAANIRYTGNLEDNIVWEASLSGGDVVISLSLADEWKYVEYGRRPGSFPNITAIRKWIEGKPIKARQGRNRLGQFTKIPKPNQLVFLIGRKIFIEGIEPKFILEKSLEEAAPLFSEELKKRIAESLVGTINLELKL